MNGGNFLSTYVSSYAQYLLKSLQGFKNQGIPIYAISIQVCNAMVLGEMG
jgi:O-glycosyl hydrolase